MQGSELKEIRNQLGLTQGEMADALGLTQAFVGMMERGEKAVERRTGLSALYLRENPHAVQGRHQHFQVYVDQAGAWRWRFVAANGELIAQSGGAYNDKASAFQGISLLKASSTAQIVEL